jgi:hypothetical protein
MEFTSVPTGCQRKRERNDTGITALYPEPEGRQKGTEIGQLDVCDMPLEAHMPNKDIRSKWNILIDPSKPP